MASFASTTYDCVVCFCTLEESQILKCKNAHSMCVDCIQRNIKINQIDGALSCVYPKCKEGFEVSECHDKTFLMNIAKLAYESLENWKESATNLQKQLSLKEKVEQDVSLTQSLDVIKDCIRKEVEASMITACPNCSQAFNGFDGCLSLQCLNCLAFFCGLCLKIAPNSQESHRHITSIHEGPEGLNGYFDVPDARYHDGPGKAFKKFERQRIETRVNAILEKCAETFAGIFENVSKTIGTPEATPVSIKNEFVKKVHLITTGENDELDRLRAELESLKTDNTFLTRRLHDSQKHTRDATERVERLERRLKEYKGAYETLRKEYDRVIELFDEPQNKAVPSRDPDPKAAEVVVVKKAEVRDADPEPARVNTIVRKARWCNKGDRCGYHINFKHNTRLGKGGARPCWYLHTGDDEAMARVNPYDERVNYQRGEGGGHF